MVALARSRAAASRPNLAAAAALLLLALAAVVCATFVAQYQTKTPWYKLAGLWPKSWTINTRFWRRVAQRGKLWQALWGQLGRLSAHALGVADRATAVLRHVMQRM